MPYQFVSVPKKSDNAGRPAGKKGYLVVFDWDDVATYTRDDKGVKVSAFSFRQGKTPIGIYATNSTQNVYHQSSGDDDARGFIHHADFQVPGTELETDEFFENNINRPLGVIMIPCNGNDCKIAGTPCYPLKITQDNSVSSSEANRHEVTMDTVYAGPALGHIVKSLVPPTDNADINAILGLGTGSSGGGL